MCDIKDTMIPLSPDPADLAALLGRMCQQSWPTTESERRRYFAAVGLRDLEVLPAFDGDPDSRSRRFTTSLEGDVDGISTMFGEEFLGLCLFCYNEPGANGPQARAGFTGLVRHLGGVFGPPVEEWGPPSEPACLWRSGLLRLDMYCFQRGSSGIMIGLDHTERSAAHDAAHRTDPPAGRD